MIAIVSSHARERAAFAALCETRGWPHRTCETVAAFRRLLARSTPAIVMIRHKLTDGYSDDVFAALKTAPRRAVSQAIVLLGAGAAPRDEARQIALGADCVLRDPVRTDVLLEYLARYRASARPQTKSAKAIRFAGALVHPLERKLSHDGKTIAVTPREMELVMLLAASRGTVLTYDMLYQEILDRPFRGESSNMRVLFAKLAASLHRLDIPLRHHVEVIPKTGYRYRQPRRPTLRLAKSSDAATSTAA